MSAEEISESHVEREGSPHVISATNFLIGSTNFLVLPLPEGCRLAPGMGAPDIEANVEHGGCYWVTDGRAHYLLYDPPRRLCLELALNITRGLTPPPAEESGRDVIYVANHPVTYRFGQRTIGFFRRTTLQTLAVTIPCGQTHRTIKLEIAGRCDRGVLEVYLELLRGLRCH